MHYNYKLLITIKLIRTNFQIRFGYIPHLSDHIKTLPKDQIQTKMEARTHDGKHFEDWFRVCNIAGLCKVILYCNKNNIPHQFENIKEDHQQKIEQWVRNKELLDQKIKDFRENGVDVSNIDYSFMKIQPYVYQKEAVQFLESVNGNAIIGDAPGIGKAQNLNALIASPNGWIRMGDIKIGQKIFHHNGKSYPVTGVFPQGIHQTYKILFSDGFSAECNIEHLWMVRDANRKRRNTGWVVKTLKDILNSGLYYKYNEKRALTGRKQTLKWEIPITMPCEYPNKKFIIHPYILGALLGDGWIKSPNVVISIPDFQIQIKERIDELLPYELKTRVNRHPNCPQYFITRKNIQGQSINPFSEEIKRLSINVGSGEKFIPKEYLYSGIEQRMELLKGLMDTDGSADRNRIIYHTTSIQLAKDVCELVQSLGGRAKLKTYERKEINKSTEFRVSIRIDFCPFNLKEKSNQWWPAKRHYMSRHIEKVELKGSEEHQCISVNSPDKTYLTNNYIVTHNTLTPVAYAIKNNLKRVLVICPASLKLNWRNEIVKFTNEKGFIFKHTKKRKEKTELYTKEESLFHIINYESLETYLKFDVHHKCNDKNCGWEETSKVKKHKFCPKCLKTKTIKSRNSDLCTFYDKKGIELTTSDYDAVVLDEAHYIGNEKSNRTKLVKAAFKNSPKKILLSGTAINNRPYEFFPLLSFIDPHEFVNSHQFGLKYCDGKEDEYGYWKYDGFSNLDELYKRISYIFLRRLKKDVLKHLPPKTFTVIKIELTPEERKEYDKLENQIVDETSESDDKMTHLARVQKLKQFTSRIRAERAIEFIKNIIDGGEKIVVFSQFIATLDYIQSHFKEISVKFDGKLTMQQKQECVDRFMTDDSCMLFAASAGAAKEGITLTSASISMFLDDLWTSTRREQCEDRIHRASQTSDKVQIIRLICEDTIDEELNRLLDEKEKVVTKVLDGESIVNDIAFSIFDDVVKLILAKKNKK